MAYTKEFLLEKLKELWAKHGIIQGTLIDAEPNFPTRKCYVRAFGSLENACELVGYNGYKKLKFDIDDAQKILDERNGHFKLLTFNGMANKSSVQCKECGAVSDIVPDSLLRNKTEEHFGCKVCNRKSFLDRFSHNNLEFIEYLDNGRCKVKCLQCDSILEGAKSNFTSPKYNCKVCGTKVSLLKISNNKKLYKEKTIKRTAFLMHLNKIISDESLQWYYCLGYLIADGNFNSENKRVKMWVNKRDENIIDKMSSFLHCESKRYKDLAGIDFCGDYIVDNLIKRYNINNQKSYSPCDLSSIQKEKLIAFIIGFVDGDGYIGYRSDSKDAKISIKLHSSWENNIQYMTNELYNYFNEKNVPQTYKVKQPQGEYMAVTWGNRNVLIGLYNFIIENNLFVLQRKWDKIINNEKEVM